MENKIGGRGIDPMMMSLTIGGNANEIPSTHTHLKKVKKVQ